ncbi:phage DNA packaging protein Nu1 [Escherichia coli PA22]|nr:phage DNA packaging protein Nu1 [Escherichia coli PA22]
MEVNKKQLADIFGASIRTIQNWQEQGMPFCEAVARVMRCFMTLPPS